MKVERTITLNAKADFVWQALTDPNLTKQYFFGCEAISDWKVGSPVAFRTMDDGVEMIHVKGKVLRAEPGVHLESTCYAAGNEEKPEKHTIVVWKLKSNDDGSTELSFSQGELATEEEFQQHNTSCDIVLNGLKELVERE